MGDVGGWTVEPFLDVRDRVPVPVLHCRFPFEKCKRAASPVLNESEIRSNLTRNRPHSTRLKYLGKCLNNGALN